MSEDYPIRDALDAGCKMWRQYTLDLIRTHTPYTTRDLTIGCPDCEQPENWPVGRWAVAGMVLLYVIMCAQVAGRWPTITSFFRCGPCNHARGGAELSRHLYMTKNIDGEHGKPYGAADIQWDSEGPAERVFNAYSTIADRLRRFLGWRVGLGMRIYGRRLHIDLRQSDWRDDAR